MSKLDPYQATAIQVGRWLREKGYRFATPDRTPIYTLEATSKLGLRPTTAGMGYWERALRSTLTDLVVATLDFHELYPQEDLQEPWILEVHGSNYLDEMKQLAQDIEKNFGAKVTARLASERSFRIRDPRR